jgi:hypothetical protein
MKNLISTLCFSIITFFAYSQEFEYLSILPETQIGTNVIETDDGDFIIGISKGPVFGAVYSFRLVKLNNQGTLIHEIELPNDTFHLSISAMIKQGSGFVAIGQSTNLYTNQHFLWFGQFDNNLTLIQSKKYSFDLNYAFLIAKEDTDGNFVIAGSRTDLGGSPFLPFIIKIDNNGNLINSKINFNINAQFVTDFLIREDTLGYIFFGFDLLVLDSAYNISYLKDIPYTLRTQGNIKYLNDSTYIFSGKQHTDLSTLSSIRDIGIATSDLQLNPLTNRFFGLQDTIDFPAAFQSLDVMNNKIYCGGIANLSLYKYPVSDYPSHFVLAQYDSVLNQQWLKYYGGDAYYIMFSLLATSDGGCIMVGHRYDFNVNNKLDLYILKVDANGNAITSTAIPLENEIITNIYPNPFMDYFKIETEANKTLSFQLFNATGQLIRQENFYNNLTINDLSMLSKGVYFYTIVDGNRVLKAGKVLKQ